jgi:hypothetical protein
MAERVSVERVHQARSRGHIRSVVNHSTSPVWSAVQRLAISVTSPFFASWFALVKPGTYWNKTLRSQRRNSH